jgi:hypothetical protein
MRYVIATLVLVTAGILIHSKGRQAKKEGDASARNIFGNRAVTGAASVNHTPQVMGVEPPESGMLTPVNPRSDATTPNPTVTCRIALAAPEVAIPQIYPRASGPVSTTTKPSGEGDRHLAGFPVALLTNAQRALADKVLMQEVR